MLGNIRLTSTTPVAQQHTTTNNPLIHSLWSDLAARYSQSKLVIRNIYNQTPQINRRHSHPCPPSHAPFSCPALPPPREARRGSPAQLRLRPSAAASAAASAHPEPTPGSRTAIRVSVFRACSFEQGGGVVDSQLTEFGPTTFGTRFANRSLRPRTQ